MSGLITIVVKMILLLNQQLPCRGELVCASLPITVFLESVPGIFTVAVYSRLNDQLSPLVVRRSVCVCVFGDPRPAAALLTMVVSLLCLKTRHVR